ncbi:MAG TPA: SDR family oxidoreductase [Anaerovoracaceae bacterium]|nr:SDR family oxidoreductase [Anaerovoracaceae bacterium]
MKKICVITGAAGGIGFGAAKKMGETHSLVISDVNKDKLDKAVSELRDMSIDAEGMVVNIAERSAVEAMAEKAKSMGEVQAVIQLGGLTPTFAPPETILRINTFGPMNMNEEFYKVMGPGGCIIDISSSAAHYIPASRVPEDIYRLSRSDKEEFYGKMMEMINASDESRRQGMAYSFSRNFVQWYVRECTFPFAKKGIRVLSVSPGLIDTEMAKTDMEKSGNLDVTISYTGFGRLGTIEEIAFLFSVLLDERNSYLTGTDIIFDGGCIAAGFRGQREPRNAAGI